MPPVHRAPRAPRALRVLRDKMAWQGTKVSQVLQVRREKMVRTAPMAIPVRTVLPASLASKAPHRLSKVPLAVLEKKA